MIFLAFWVVVLSLIMLLVVAVDKAVQWDEGKRIARERAHMEESIKRDVRDYRNKKFKEDL